MSSKPSSSSNPRDVIEAGHVLAQGRRIRGVRQARHYTQRQLATLAGVSERTVRNAEGGRPVRLASLAAISQQLDAPLEDFTADQAERRVVEANVDRMQLVIATLERFMQEKSALPFLDIARSDFSVRLIGPDELPLIGEYSGKAGLQSYDDLVHEHQWSLPIAAEFHEVRSSGDLAVLRGRDAHVDPLGGPMRRCDFMHSYVFESGRLARVDVSGDFSWHLDVFRKGLHREC